MATSHGAPAGMVAGSGVGRLQPPTSLARASPSPALGTVVGAGSGGGLHTATAPIVQPVLPPLVENSFADARRMDSSKAEPQFFFLIVGTSPHSIVRPSVHTETTRTYFIKTFITPHVYALTRAFREVIAPAYLSLWMLTAKYEVLAKVRAGAVAPPPLPGLDCLLMPSFRPSLSYAVLPVRDGSNMRLAKAAIVDIATLPPESARFVRVSCPPDATHVRYNMVTSVHYLNTLMTIVSPPGVSHASTPSTQRPGDGVGAAHGSASKPHGGANPGAGAGGGGASFAMPLPIASMRHILRCVTLALAVLHKHCHHAHRGVVPSNVITYGVDPATGMHRIKLHPISIDRTLASYLRMEAEPARAPSLLMAGKGVDGGVHKADDAAVMAVDPLPMSPGHGSRIMTSAAGGGVDGGVGATTSGRGGGGRPPPSPSASEGEENEALHERFFRPGWPLMRREERDAPPDVAYLPPELVACMAPSLTTATAGSDAGPSTTSASSVNLSSEEAWMAADMFGLGCLLFYMCTGEHPSMHPGQLQHGFPLRFTHIPDTKREVGLPDYSMRLDLLAKLTLDDPRERFTVDDVLEHPFFKLRERDELLPVGPVTMAAVPAGSSRGGPSLPVATAGGSAPMGPSGGASASRTTMMDMS